MPERAIIYALFREMEDPPGNTDFMKKTDALEILREFQLRTFNVDINNDECNHTLYLIERAIEAVICSF